MGGVVLVALPTGALAAGDWVGLVAACSGWGDPVGEWAARHDLLRLQIARR